MANQLVSLDGFERAAGGEEGLHQSDHHHADHHYGEDGDGVAAHVHHQEVHRHLLNRSEGEFPGLFDNQMALVGFFGHLVVVLSRGRIVARRGGIRIAFGHSSGSGK